MVEGRDLIGASWRTGWSSIAYVVARNRGAKDWSNGLTVRGNLVGKSNAAEYHHIFPQSLLYRPNGPYDSRVAKDQQRVNEIANIAYLTSGSNKEIGNKKPAEYLPRVQERFPQALEQQSVPLNPALWELDRYEDFLAARRELLANAINDFMESLIADAPTERLTIDDYVRAGESETVEFKGSLRWDYREQRVNKELTKVVAKTIAAFMNAAGGTLVVGVSDEGDAWGLEADFATLAANHQDADGWQQLLVATLSNYLGGHIAPLVECSFADFQGKTVAVVHADPWHKPVFLSDGTASEFYVRAGNTTKRLDGESLVSYIKNRFPVLA